jgi:hypothetical protein
MNCCLHASAASQLTPAAPSRQLASPLWRSAPPRGRRSILSKRSPWLSAGCLVELWLEGAKICKGHDLMRSTTDVGMIRTAVTHGKPQGASARWQVALLPLHGHTTSHHTARGGVARGPPAVRSVVLCAPGDQQDAVGEAGALRASRCRAVSVSVSGSVSVSSSANRSRSVPRSWHSRWAPRPATRWRRPWSSTRACRRASRSRSRSAGGLPTGTRRPTDG